jgi:hypothetical protein
MQSCSIVRLDDVVRAAFMSGGGMDEICRVLEVADQLLAAEGGRECDRPLTDAELASFGYSR